MDVRIREPWLSKRRVAKVLAVVASVLATAFAYAHYGLARTQVVDRDKLIMSTVQAAALSDFIPVTGRTEPLNTMFLGAVNGGQVAEIFVEEGALVAAGDPILRLSNTALQLEVIGREAQVSEQINRLTSTKVDFEQQRLTHARELIDTRHQLELAMVRIDRMRALSSTGAITRADLRDTEIEISRLRDMERELQKAKNADETLQAAQIRQLDDSIGGLKQNLSVARQSLDNLTIKAPVPGQLTALQAHPGELKQAGDRLGQIDATDGFKIVANVDEHYVGRISAGQRTVTEIDGKTHSLAVAKVYPEVRDRQFRVDFQFTDTAPASLRRGQTLQLRVQLSESTRSLVVANGPFFEDTAGQWAFVVTDDPDTAERRAVRLGRRTVERIEVLEGLVAGEQVITSSYDRFGDVERVKLRDPSR